MGPNTDLKNVPNSPVIVKLAVQKALLSMKTNNRLLIVGQMPGLYKLKAKGISQEKGGWLA